MEEALDQAQDLQRGVESLDRRLDSRSRADTGEPGDEDAEGGEAGDSTGEGAERGGDAGERGEAGSEAGERGGEEGARAGEAGERGEAGQQAGGRGDGSPGARGPNGPYGGANPGSPRPFTDEEIRQFRREFEERFEDARQLRDALREEGRETPDLDRALDALDRLRNVQTYQDLPQIAILRETLRENIGRVEFSLRRELRGEAAGRAALRGSDDIPPGFRRLVEEYYRSLARGGGSDGGGNE
jgi:hypothetical protein